MRTFIFIIGAMFFIIGLFSLHFRFWPELLMMGMSGIAIGFSIGGGTKNER